MVDHEKGLEQGENAGAEGEESQALVAVDIVLRRPWRGVDEEERDDGEDPWTFL